MLNTSGLSEAYKRKQLGTANQTDLANLNYATGKGWKPETTPTAPTNPTSDTISTGITNSNISSNLPTSNDAAMKLYADNSLTDSTKLQSELQTNLDKFNTQRIQQNKTDLNNEQANLKDIQAQQDTQVAGFDAQVKPFNDSVISNATNRANALNNSYQQADYEKLLNDKKSLTNDIISYSKMFSDEMAQAETQVGLSSVSTGRKNQVIENYTSKIAVAQAASSAIDGNFTLASDILEKGANNINQLATDRLNFINTVQTLFSSKETDSKNKILSLTTEQNKLLDQAKNDAQTKLDNIQKNKETIMSLMETNPIIANKAGLLLTDTQEQIATKLNSFYVKYPQYTSDNQSWIKQSMEKYYDAGITLNDPIETVKSKIQMSKIYQKETATISGGSDSTTTQGVIVDPTGNAYDISSYATDPNHETAVQNLINGMGQFKSVSDIDNYIKSKYPNSPVTGQMIYNAAEKYGVSWEAMTAMMEQDSSLGTAGKGARTFNPGNVGNDDSGNIRNYGNWQSGVDAVAQWLSSHKTSNQSVVSDDVKNWSNQVLNGQRKFSDVPKELQTAVNNYMASTGSISKTDSEVNAKLQDKITQIDNIINSKGLKQAVGPNPLARMSLTTWATGERQAFQGSVKQLLSKETIDTLLNLKKGGGTLGALSDQERIMLQTAATKIGGWEIKDKQNNGTGFYNVSEKDFIKELQNIKDLAKRAVDNAGGQTGIVNNLEQNLASNPDRIDEYNKLVSDNPNLTEDDINQLMGFTQ